MTTILVTCALTGLVAGFLAGLLGIGGGLVIVPLLMIVFSTQGCAPEVGHRNRTSMKSGCCATRAIDVREAAADTPRHDGPGKKPAHTCRVAWVKGSTTALKR